MCSTSFLASGRFPTRASASTTPPSHGGTPRLPAARSMAPSPCTAVSTESPGPRAAKARTCCAQASTPSRPSSGTRALWPAERTSTRLSWRSASSASRQSRRPSPFSAAWRTKWCRMVPAQTSEAAASSRLARWAALAALGTLQSPARVFANGTGSQPRWCDCPRQPSARLARARSSWSSADAAPSRSSADSRARPISLRPSRPWMKQYTSPSQATETEESAEAEWTTGLRSLARCCTQARSARSTSCSSTPASRAATIAFADSSCTCLYGWETPSCRAGTMPRSTSTRTSSETAALLRRRLTRSTWRSRSLLACACEDASPSPVPTDCRESGAPPFWMEPTRKLVRRSTAAPSVGSVPLGRRRRETPERA
mmetsp:Transcript_21328/g.59157  ORF Transcript_21328/g.59157 Transcript_21328/m.59157 type:complete len:371 (-) Transcript_21328:561-1673(-)